MITRASRRPIAIVVSAAVVGAAVGCESASSSTRFRAELQPDAVLAVSAGAARNSVSLGGDIVGCQGELFDPGTKQRFGTRHLRNTVLDVAEDGADRFVLISAAAAANCNVQGQCGAADSNVTLIWLHLDAQLAVRDKQVFAVEQCPRRWVEGERAGWAERLALRDGKLVLKFIEMDTPAGRVDPVEVSGSVTYSHRDAGSGIQVSRQ